MAQLIDHDGIVRFDGTLNGVATDTVVTFEETPATIGYTAEIELPAESAVEWVLVIMETPWTRVPTLTVGDSEQAGAFFNAYLLDDPVGAWQWPIRTLGTENAVSVPESGIRELYTLYPEGTTLTLSATALASEDVTGVTKIIVHHHTTEPGPTPTLTPED